MAISQYSVRTKAKQLAQDGGPGDTPTGVQLLLTDPGDYNIAILQSLLLFSKDRPNLRVVDSVLTVAGFRQVLAGAGVMPGLTGVDAFVDGFSRVRQVFFPWDAAMQGLEPLSENDWREVKDPAKQILEFLDVSPAVGQTVRLSFTSPHGLTEHRNTVAAPAAPVASLITPATPGVVTNGTHSCQATYLTGTGETDASAASNIVTVADQTVNGRLTVIVAASPDPGVTGTRLFMSVAGNAGNKKFVSSLATNGGTFTVNTADGSLGADAPITNTAGGGNTVLDGDEDLLAMLTASMVLELAAVKSAQNTGNTGLPNDVVDRRTQSDIFRSRSRELKDLYNTLVGKGPKSDVTAASGTRDLNVKSSWGGRFLTHEEQQ